MFEYLQVTDHKLSEATCQITDLNVHSSLLICIWGGTANCYVVNFWMMKSVHLYLIKCRWPCCNERTSLGQSSFHSKQREVHCSLTASTVGLIEMTSLCICLPGYRWLEMGNPRVLNIIMLELVIGYLFLMQYLSCSYLRWNSPQVWAQAKGNSTKWWGFQDRSWYWRKLDSNGIRQVMYAYW